MKKIILTAITCFSFWTLMAQNEGQFGIFSGVNHTTLNNAADKALGDLLPTYKPTFGAEASYHFTLFKAIPTGFTVQLMNNRLGQNYHGYYTDSSSYFAYRRLSYMRAGIGWNIGTNIRRQVSVTFTTGITYGILVGYQDRYELVRYNNDKLIMDVKNNDINYYDTVQIRGTLNNSLFNKTDMTYYAALGMNFLLNKRIVLGVQYRYDMGLNNVENTGAAFSINYKTTPNTIQGYKPYHTKTLYHGPLASTPQRAETANQFMGIYLSLKYRIYNKEKIEFWYREHRNSNY